MSSYDTNNNGVWFYWGSTGVGQITGLLARFDSEFLKYVSPVVNKTWVYGTDENTYSCPIDKFWLLGFGNVNPNLTNNEDFYDFKFDTSIFSSIFTNDDSRIKPLMDSETGEESASGVGVWNLRSAVGYSGLPVVFLVMTDGSIQL